MFLSERFQQESVRKSVLTEAIFFMSWDLNLDVNFFKFSILFESSGFCFRTSVYQ